VNAKRLASVISEGEVGTGSVRFGAVTITPTQRLVANVDELIVGKIKHRRG